jgi:hypothetical protein
VICLLSTRVSNFFMTLQTLNRLYNKKMNTLQHSNAKVCFIYSDIYECYKQLLFVGGGGEGGFSKNIAASEII